MNSEYFMKPELHFPMNWNSPLINIYIKRAYQEVQTWQQFIDFTHMCIQVSIDTNNKVKRDSFRSVGYTMYSVITGQSYESKITI